MRICYVGDPRSVHTQRWVRWFADRHEVHLVRTAQSDALPGISGPTFPAQSFWPGARLLASVGLLRRTIAEIQPHVLHAHFINEGGWFAAAASHRPFVLTTWGSDVYQAPSRSRLAAVLNPWAARRADRLTCDSEDQRARLKTWGVPPDRVSVIGWGVDIADFRPDLEKTLWRARLGIPEEAIVILSPRQWLPNSNIDVAIRAHEKLGEQVYLILKRLPRFEGAHAAGVERAVRESPAANRIRIVSEIPEKELSAFYATADCLVTLCETDGTPMSVLEGMAVGLPIVAFDTASLREWVAEPGGLIVTSLAPEAVAQALRRFTEDAAARVSAREHNTGVIARRANREREMSRVEDLYNAILEHDG